MAAQHVDAVAALRLRAGQRGDRSRSWWLRHAPTRLDQVLVERDLQGVPTEQRSSSDLIQRRAAPMPRFSSSGLRALRVPKETSLRMFASMRFSEMLARMSGMEVSAAVWSR
jgi:hypothetical protein